MSDPMILQQAPSAQKSSTKSSFMSLPGEIRNKVYDNYYVQRIVYLYPSGHSDPPYKIVNWIQPAVNARVRREQYEEDIRRLKDSRPVRHQHAKASATLSCLHLTNKEIYLEVILLLYATATFAATESDLFLGFVQIMPHNSLKMISNLILTHRTCEPGQYNYDEVEVSQHQVRWEQTCLEAAKALPSLNKLHVVLDLRHPYLRFDLHEPWCTALYSLGEHCRKLTDVTVALVGSERDWQFPDREGSRPGILAYYMYGLIGVESYEACERLRGLFGEAIAKKILGASDAEALQEYNGACAGPDGLWDFNFCKHIHRHPGVSLRRVRCLVSAGYACIGD